MSTLPPVDSEDLFSGENKFVSRNRPPPETLPFSHRMQAAMIGWTLTDATFFVQCVAKVKPDWFDNSYHKRVWDAVLKFYRKYLRCPTDDEMLALADLRAEDPAWKNGFKAALVEARGSRTTIALEVIIDQMTDWLQATIQFTSIDAIARAHAAKDYATATALQIQSGKDLAEAQFRPGAAYDFTKWDEQFAQEATELGDALTTGLTALDKALTPQAKKGSLLLGDATLVLAPVGGGKTATMSTIAAANALAKQDVLVVHHEGRPAELRNRLMCYLLSRPDRGIWMTNAGLQEAHQDPTWRKRLDFVANEILTKYLVLVPMLKAGVSCEETGAMVRAQMDEHYAKTGRRFKMVVCDYPGKETTDQARTVKMEWRQKVEVIYNYWAILAGELGTHNVIAWQTNREGFKVSRGRKGTESRLLDLDDSAECFAVSQPVANCITCNLDPITHNMTFLVAKTRSLEKKIAVTCVSRLSSGMTHHEDAGYCWYDGTMPLGDRTAEFLTRYSKQEVPPGELHGF